jgi:hypothetical protein
MPRPDDFRRLTGPLAARKQRQASPGPEAELERKILAVGGSSVVWPTPPVSYLEELLARGRRITGRIVLLSGERNNCHVNAGGLWGRERGRFRIATGYALERGLWRQHSWLLEPESASPARRPAIYETTFRFERYFGIVLNDQEALHFWAETFYAVYLDGPMRLDAKRRGMSMPEGDSPDPRK